MKKKFLSVALATTMVMSSVVPASAETLTGTKWWDETQSLSNVLTGNGTITYGVTVDALDSSNYGAFTVRVDGLTSAVATTTNADTDETTNVKGYITTTSEAGGWYYDASGDALEHEKTGTIATNNGDKYEVTVSRDGNNFTVEYYNKTTGAKDICKANNTTFVCGDNDNAKVHFVNISGVNTATIDESSTTDVAIADGTSVTYDIDVTTAGVFWIEIYGNVYGNGSVITNTDYNGWYADCATGDAVTGVKTGVSSLAVGEYYTVTVKREDNTFTITYKKDGEQFMEATFANSNIVAESVNVVFVAQIGTYEVVKLPDTDSSQSTQNTPVYVQYKQTGTDTYTIRVVAEVTLDGTFEESVNTSYTGAGFRCAKNANVVSTADVYASKVVFKSIMANGTKVTASADDKYFVVTEITDVTSTSSVYVTPVYTTVNAAATAFTENVYTINMADIIK